MKNDSDTIRLILSNKAFLYNLLWRIFAQEPDQALLDAIQNSHTEEEVMLLVDDIDEIAIYADVVEALRGIETDKQLETLTLDYTRLFIGPGRLLAPPWESIYVNEEELLFQLSTLEVRHAYERAGFASNGFPRYPDDHIATELAFLKTLSNRLVGEYSIGNMTAAAETVEALNSFLDSHLLKWLDLFYLRVSAAKGITAFYPEAASLALYLCMRDRRINSYLQAKAICTN